MNGILLHTWRQQRTRFLICLGITIVYSVALVLLFRAGTSFQSNLLLTPEDQRAILAEWSRIDLFLVERWAETILFAVFAIVLSLGGPLTDSRSDSIHYTLGLPVHRRTWLRVHAILASAGVLILIALSIGIVGGGTGDAPWARLFGSGLLQWLTGLTVIAMSWLVSTFVRPKAGSIHIVIMIGLVVLLSLLPASANLFEQAGRSILTGALPGWLIAATVIFSIGCYTLAEKHVTSLDF